MGRISKPQKSTKHKKIKFVDPFYHGDRKERMFAGHNLDPSTKDLEQKISRSQRFLLCQTKLTQELKNKSRRQKKQIIKKKLQKHMYVHPGQKELQEVPKFKQQQGESHAIFMNRVESTAMNAIKEAQMVASMKLKREGEPDDATEIKATSKKKERLKIKKQLQKEKKQAKMEDRKDDYDKFIDKVEFGDIVTAPPILSVRPRHAQVSDKPAVKNLLLYDMIKKNSENNSGSTTQNKSFASGSATNTTDKGTKRKLLSPAQKLKMERERQDVIDLYRKMKKKPS